MSVEPVFFLVVMENEGIWRVPSKLKVPLPFIVSFTTNIEPVGVGKGMAKADANEADIPILKRVIELTKARAKRVLEKVFIQIRDVFHYFL